MFDRQSTISFAASALLHIGLIVAVIGGAVVSRPEITTQPVQTTVSDHAIREPDEEFSGAIDAANAPPTMSIDQKEVKAPPAADDPGLAAFARKRLEQARKVAEEQSSNDQLVKLESLGRRLEQVASTASLQDVSQTLSKWLGASERAAGPTGPLGMGGGEFDVATAQISEVNRIETDDGVTYVALLVDARGTSKEALLDETDGPRLYETFQLMKRFPLLESVYRGTVMGLLDKLVLPTETPQDSAAEPPPAEADEQKE